MTLTKQNIFGILLLFITVTYSNAFIVPEELPSILSLVYSTIPQIKKGTDSRIGIGYRLGDHADFQVLLELGPQTNTRKIGANTNQSKRNLKEDDVKQIQKEKVKESWLESWHKQIKQQKLIEKANQAAASPSATISESSLKQLQQLYGNNHFNNNNNDNNNDDERIIEDNENIDVGVLPADKQPSEHLPHSLDTNNLLRTYLLRQSINKQEQENKQDDDTKRDIDKITADLSNVDID